jgi:hypothetical protein
MSYFGRTIAIHPEGDAIRKVTKIVSLSDGGFSVVTPYHKEKTGYLFKLPVDPSQLPTFSRHWQETVGFTAECRAKLSYHVDGFAQFSSEKQGELVSGRDPETGEPRGLGLLTHPLCDPIWSGPSVNVTLWGLGDYVPLDDPTDATVFEPHDFYYRGCTPSDANAWVLSIYVFPAGVDPPCRQEGRDMALEVAFEPLNGPLASVARMRVVRLPESGVLLGIMVNRAVVTFPSKSGWIINGPGDYSAQERGHVLTAVYPREAIPVDGRSSLDRHAQ